SPSEYQAIRPICATKRFSVCACTEIDGARQICRGGCGARRTRQIETGFRRAFKGTGDRILPEGGLHQCCCVSAKGNQGKPGRWGSGSADWIVLVSCGQAGRGDSLSGKSAIVVSECKCGCGVHFGRFVHSNEKLSAGTNCVCEDVR